MALAIINLYLAITLVIGFTMTGVHYLVVFAVFRRASIAHDAVLAIEHDGPIFGGKIVALDDQPSDYRKSVLPDQEEVHAAWIEKARNEALRIVKLKGTITSDDIWNACPPPPGADPRVMGAVFAEKSVWEKLNVYVKSERKINHGRPVAQWKLRAA